MTAGSRCTYLWKAPTRFSYHCEASRPSFDLSGQFKVHVLLTCANSTRALGKADSHFRFSLLGAVLFISVVVLSNICCRKCFPYRASVSRTGQRLVILLAMRSLRTPPVYDCFTLLARTTRSEQEGYKPLSLRSIRSPAFYSSQIECLRSPRTVHFCAVSYDVVCSQRRPLFVTIHLLRTTVSHTSSSHLIALPFVLCEPSMRASSSSSSSLPTPSLLDPTHTHTHTHTRPAGGQALRYVISIRPSVRPSVYASTLL